MRRIYAIILGSSLISAVVVCLISSIVFTGPEFGIDPRGLAAIFVVVFFGVWLGFLICCWAIQRNVTPNIWKAIGMGFVVGGLGFLVLYAVHGNLTTLLQIYPPGLPISAVIFDQFQIFVALFLFGGVVGVFLGAINFAVWLRLDVVRQLLVLPIREKPTQRSLSIILGNSLLQALASGMVLSSLGSWQFPNATEFTLITVLTLVSVWLGVFYAYLVMRRNMTPTPRMAAGLGLVLGGLNAVVFGSSIFNPFPMNGPIAILYLVIFLIGAVIGIPFGLVNFKLWSRIGFIGKSIEASDDTKFERVFEEASERAAGQQGAETPPPRIPDKDAPRP